MTGTETRIPVWSAKRDASQRVETDAVVFGTWAAFHHLDPEEHGEPILWGVRNIPANLQTWHVPREVAVEAARLLEEQLPQFGLGWPNGKAPDDQIKAWREISQKVFQQALHKHPPLAARPFVVELVRRVEFLVFAEDERSACVAVRGIDDDEIEDLFRRADDRIESSHCGAFEAARQVGVHFEPTHPHMHLDSSNYFWVVQRKAYMPSHCPAPLYLAPTGREDHAGNCPANASRRSSLGTVELGPCECDARVFPAPPVKAGEL